MLFQSGFYRDSSMSYLSFNIRNVGCAALPALVLLLGGCTDTSPPLLPELTVMDQAGDPDSDQGSTPPPISDSDSPFSNPDDDRGWIGVVLPYRAVDVKANAAGILVSVLVRPGDHVIQDLVMGVVDDPSLDDRLALEQKKLQAAQAEHQGARYTAQQEQARYERRLAAPDAISKDELDAAEMGARAAGAREAAARAAVEEQQLLVEQMELSRDSGSITAPFDGQVINNYLDAGALVMAGDPVVRMSTTGQLLARFAVPPDEAENLELGDAVTLVLETSGRQVNAEVVSITPSLDIPTQMVFVEAYPVDEDKRLVAGQSIRVRPGSAEVVQR